MAIVLLRRFVSVLSRTERILWWWSLGILIISIIFFAFVGIERSIKTVPKYGGEYSEALVGRPQFINPLFATSNDTDRDLVKLIFAGLLKPVTNSEGISFEPDLAESVTVNDDQTLYTITLKPNLTWQDGRPLTSDDVLFTLQSIQNPDWKSPLAVSFRGAQIQRSDDRIVTIKLTQPFTLFLQTLTVGIVPQHLWKNVLPSNARLAEYNIKPVGAGPYRFSAVTKDKDGLIHSYTLERNQYYHDQKPYLDRILVRFYDTIDQAITAVERGEAEGLQVLPKQYRQRLANRSNLHSFLLRLPQSTDLFFNRQQGSPLQDPIVRDALARGINKQELIDTALLGEGEIIQGPLLPGMTGYDSELKGPQYNIEEAGKLLESAGWKRVETTVFEAQVAAAAAKAASAKSTTASPPPEPTPAPKPSGMPYYRVKRGESLKLSITTIDQRDLKESAEQIATGWRALGIETTVHIVDAKDFQSQILAPRNFETLLYGQIINSDSDPYPFWHSSQAKAPGLNLAQLNDKKIDQFIDQARKTSDPKQRAEILKEFQRQLVSQLPAVFLYSPTYTYVLPTTINGMSQDRITKPSDRWNTLPQWYKKTRWALK